MELRIPLERSALEFGQRFLAGVCPGAAFRSPPRQNIGDAGLWTAIRHPSGISSRYLHLSRTLVKVGQHVQRGERIGLAGDTASPGVPHLHLDLRAPATMLPSIEATIGRPRSGWGPEMQPFGHSIPGEPFIPVDAYREIVRTEAAEMGIPLRDPSLPRNGAVAYVICDHDASGDLIVICAGPSRARYLDEARPRRAYDWIAR